MIAGLPRQPDGSNAEAVFHRHTYEALQRARMTQAPGMRVNNTTRGVSVVPVPQRAVAVSPEQLYYFLFVGPVTLIGVGCHTWNPQTEAEGEDLVYVAFPHDMMPQLIPGRVMPDGSKQTYDYSSIGDQQRVMTKVGSDPLVTVTQQITPALCAADATDPDTYPATIVTARSLYTGFFIDDVPVNYMMHGMTIHWGNV